MFEIGFLEMVLVAIVALLVLGPDKLPGAVRVAGLYIGKIKRSMADVRAEVERELGADEIRQTLHNERIMAELAKKSGTSNVKRPNQDQEAEARVATAETTATVEPNTPASDTPQEPSSTTTPDDNSTPRT